MGVDEQEIVEVVGARTAQLFGREADAMHAVLVKRADELRGLYRRLARGGRVARTRRRDRRLRGQALAEREDGGREGVSENDEVEETAREERLRCAVASVTGFDLRRQRDGTYQIVWMSELTGAALPFEDGMTLDDVERWVDENAEKQH